VPLVNSFQTSTLLCHADKRRKPQPQLSVDFPDPFRKGGELVQATIGELEKKASYVYLDLARREHWPRL